MILRTLLFSLSVLAIQPIFAQSIAEDSKNLQVFDKFDDFQNFLDQNGDTQYVVNFWATWCKPCVAELPYFERLQQELNDSGSEAQVLLVSLDFKRHIKRKLIPFIKKKEIQTKIIVLDDSKTNVWIDKVDKSWGGSIPATLVYKGGKQAFVEHEFSSYQELKEFVNPYLN